MIRDLGHATALVSEVTLMAVRGTDGINAWSIAAATCSGVFVAAMLYRQWRKFDAGEYSQFAFPS